MISITFEPGMGDNAYFMHTSEDLHKDGYVDMIQTFDGVSKFETSTDCRYMYYLRVGHVFDVQKVFQIIVVALQYFYDEVKMIPFKKNNDFDDIDKRSDDVQN